MKTESRAVVGLALCWAMTSSLAWGVPAAVPPVSGESAAVPRARGRATSSGRPARAPLGKEALEKLRDLLAGTDEELILTATRALAESGAVNAASPLIEMLAVGARPAATVAAIDALKKLRDPACVEVLVLYAGNRSPEIRRHAVEALGVFADARVVPTLMGRLGDAVPEVRAAAAEALATRGEKAAAPRMMALLKRNDAAAAAPLGMLAAVGSVPRIAELQGSIDDDNLATALGELLKRNDVPDPVRVDVIKTLARVSGAASTTALVEYVGSLPERDRRPSKVEAQKTIDDRAKRQ